MSSSLSPSEIPLASGWQAVKLLHGHGLGRASGHQPQGWRMHEQQEQQVPCLDRERCEEPVRASGHAFPRSLVTQTRGQSRTLSWQRTSGEWWSRCNPADPSRKASRIPQPTLWSRCEGCISTTLPPRARSLCKQHWEAAFLIVGLAAVVVFGTASIHDLTSQSAHHEATQDPVQTTSSGLQHTVISPPRSVLRRHVPSNQTAHDESTNAFVDKNFSDAPPSPTASPPRSALRKQTMPSTSLAAVSDDHDAQQDDNASVFPQLLSGNGSDVNSTKTWLATHEPTFTSTNTSTNTTTTSTTTTATTSTTLPHPWLFCWSHMRRGGPEEELVRMQFQNRISIFQCDSALVISTERMLLGELEGKAVYTWANPSPAASKGTRGVNGSTTDSYLNTHTFIKAWEMLMGSGVVWSFDFVVKVDPDAVFLPERLRGHVKPHMGKDVYFANCGKWGGQVLLYGAVEVFSSQALRRYWENNSTCASIPWQGWGEDYYLQQCMDALSVESVPDLLQVADKRCVDAPCSDYTKVAFHDYKDPKEYLHCYEVAVGNLSLVTDLVPRK